MSKFLDVPEFFRSVYVVDLSPSLCEIARERFARLGWKNVKVVCQDARAFRVEDHESVSDDRSLVRVNSGEYGSDGRKKTRLGAELVTISYALSMIPEFYSAIDSISSQLSPNGIVGVIDFYVQSQVEFQSRNYVGGVIDRHCMWLSRVFWRTWFEIDRVNLEPARRVCHQYNSMGMFSDSNRTISSTSLEPFSTSTPATTSLVYASPITSGLAAPRTAALLLPSWLKSTLPPPSLLSCPLSIFKPALRDVSTAAWSYTPRPMSRPL